MIIFTIPLRMTLAHLASHLILPVLRHFYQEEVETIRCTWKVRGTRLAILSASWISRLTHVVFACNNHHNNGFHYGIFMPVYNVSPVTLPLTDPFSTDWVTGIVVVGFMQRVVCVLVTQLRIILKEFALGWKSYRKNSNFRSFL